jgi:hypothetical protein
MVTSGPGSNGTTRRRAVSYSCITIWLVWLQPKG